MKRALLVGLAVPVLLVAVAAVVLVRDDERAPLPSADQLRTSGFAVWPEDTVEEGMAACENAEPWRLDAADTALRFAANVLRFRQPRITHTIDPWPPDNGDRRHNTVRLFVGDALHEGRLPMIIDVDRYDRCWFVVGAEPREDAFPATVAYVHPSREPHVVIQSSGERTEVGYGLFSRTFTGDKQAVFDLSGVSPNATGHVIALGCHRVCDASASTLGFAPEPATTQVARAAGREIAGTPEICSYDSYRRPLAAIALLYTFTFDNAVAQRGRKVLFKPGDGVDHVSGDRWILRVDDAELSARIPQLRQKCHRIVSIRERGHTILSSLHVEPEWFTFDLNWRNATSADISLISATGRGGGGAWRFERLDGPLTLRNATPLPANEPFYVTVVIRKGRSVISAERTWYRTP